LGTIAGETPAVVIRTSDGVRTLRPGDEWPGLGQIEAIKRNELLVRQPDGQLVRVRPGADGGAPAGSTPAARTPAAAPPATATAPPPPPGAQGITQTGPGQWHLGPDPSTGRPVDVAALLQQGQLVQHVVNGTTEGYTVVRPGPVLQRLGVVRGDIVVGINGTPLGGPEQAQELLSAMPDASQIVLEVMRGQQRLTLEYDLR
jgi:hypothetical protein